MTSDNIAEYVGENNQFTEKPVTEYPPVIQDNTVTTKDYLYSNNIDTDLLVVIGGLIVILFLMMLIMYFINSLRHKELTEILTKISFPEKSGSNLLKPEAVSCNLLSLCVLAPVLCTPRKLAEVSREIIVASAQEITRDLRKVIHLKGRLTFLFFLSITNGNTICNTTHIAVG